MCLFQVQIDRIMDEIDIDHDGKVRANKQTQTWYSLRALEVLRGYSEYSADTRLKHSI